MTSIQANDRAGGAGRPKPRVWTVFVAFTAALGGILLAQAAVAIALLTWHAVQIGDLQQAVRELPARLTSPWGFIFLGLVSQCVVGAAAVVPARFSPEPMLSRLGLNRPGLPGWTWPVIAVGSLFPLAVGLVFADVAVRAFPFDPSFEQLYGQMTWGSALAFLVFVTTAPAFMEEMFFRGYMQRRLQQRWSQWTAIAVTSLLFALMHVTPSGVAGAFPIGLWLGILAWRTGSIWPGVACHALINGSWNLWQIGNRLAELPEAPPAAAVIPGGLLIVGCFIATIWLVNRPAGTRSNTMASGASP